MYMSWGNIIPSTEPVGISGQCLGGLAGNNLTMPEFVINRSHPKNVHIGHWFSGLEVNNWNMPENVLNISQEII